MILLVILILFVKYIAFTIYLNLFAIKMTRRRGISKYRVGSSTQEDL